MGVQIRERTIEEIEKKLESMQTALNKISYLESAVKAGFSFEIKRFLWKLLAELYEGRKMFERAARAMATKAGMEVMFRDKVDSYVTAAELFARIGKVDDADDMFVRASRDADASRQSGVGSRESGDWKSKIRLARKNIYLISANELEAKGKKASAVKFYEKLMTMNLEDVERDEIRVKLLERYKALGMFREAKLLGE